jgi:hypothetical protein
MIEAASVLTRNWENALARTDRLSPDLEEKGLAIRPNPLMFLVAGGRFTAGLRPAFAPRIHSCAVVAAPNLSAALRAARRVQIPPPDLPRQPQQNGRGITPAVRELGCGGRIDRGPADRVCAAYPRLRRGRGAEPLPAAARLAGFKSLPLTCLATNRQNGRGVTPADLELGCGGGIYRRASPGVWRSPRGFAARGARTSAPRFCASRSEVQILSRGAIKKRNGRGFPRPI